MGSIYKITNDVNDKIYIGQTINDINYRFRSHINEARQCDHQNKFHLALLEIGPEHFKIEEIEKCDNDKLNERECYWIKYYNSVNNGYNTTWGGSTGIHYDRQMLLDLWNQGLNIQKISNTVGIDRGLLGQILRTEGISEEELKNRHYESNRIQSKNRKVYQIDPKTGNIIKTWNLISEITKQLHIHHSTIIKCCQKKPQSKTAGGFAWRYVEDYNEETDKEELIQYTIRDIFKNTKHVLQYDSNNNLMHEFNSVKEAGLSLNKKPENIARYCRENRKDLDGYIWKYKT